MTNRGALGTVKALNLALQKEPKMAMCPQCAAPLIATMAFSFKEFICLECGRLWEFLDPKGAVETPEITARYETLKAEWDEHVRPFLIPPRSFKEGCDQCSPSRDAYHRDHATDEELAADLTARAWLAERTGATA